MAQRKQKKVSRRNVVAGLSAVAALAATGAPKKAAASERRSSDYPGKPSAKKPPRAVEEAKAGVSPAKPTPEVQALFSGLAPGAPLGPCALVAVHPLTCGSIPVVLEQRGTPFQIDIMRSDTEGPQAPEQTGSLAFFISNQGDGNRVTQQEQHEGIKALACELATRDASKLKDLLTFRQRQARFPRGIYEVG